MDTSYNHKYLLCVHICKQYGYNIHVSGEANEKGEEKGELRRLPFLLLGFLTTFKVLTLCVNANILLQTFTIFTFVNFLPIWIEKSSLWNDRNHKTAWVCGFESLTGRLVGVLWVIASLMLESSWKRNTIEIPLTNPLPDLVHPTVLILRNGKDADNKGIEIESVHLTVLWLGPQTICTFCPYRTL